MKCYAKSSENLIVQLANLPPKPPFLSKSFHLFSCTGKTHYLCISSAKNKEQNKTFLPFNFQNIGRQLVQYAASASGYYSTFRGLLKIAYRDKWLRENINDYLDKIEPQDVKKEYLTLDEVKQLAVTPCDIPVLKAASLFACLTGLRISDILNLQWEDFAIAPDQGYCLRIRTQKTQTEATLPISYEAYELCGTPDTGKVFKGLKRSMINYPLKNWLKKAGITKPITFHGFRHSYAVIQISLGTDIYTVSKMLTHKNVSTTQIYADLVNVKKRETANKISLK